MVGLYGHRFAFSLALLIYNGIIAPCRPQVFSTYSRICAYIVKVLFIKTRWHVFF